MPASLSVLIWGGTPTAEVVMDAASKSLSLRGQEATGAAVVDELANGIALAIFATMPDPSDTKMVRDVASHVRAQIIATVAAMCKAAAAVSAVVPVGTMLL